MTKRKKTIVIIITLILLFMSVTGCSRNNASHTDEDLHITYDDNKVEGLRLVSDTKDPLNHDFRTYILYDMKTSVMYAMIRDYYNSASAFGFFNLVDENGKPRLYNPEEENGKLTLLSDTKDPLNHDFRTYILYDTKTSVMYAMVRDYYNVSSAFGVSVLLNPDGTPRLYKP